MKTLAFMLLLAAGVKADPCVCGGCAGFAHREAVGICAACKGGNLTIDDTYCGQCARKASSCMHCGRKLRNPKLVIGEVFRVDKQPRADLTYTVLKGEDGTSHGLYFDPKRHTAARGRVLLFAAEDAKGALVVREQRELGPKEKDLQVKGESAGPVFWCTWHWTGPETPSKDGKYALVLPALPFDTVEVVSGANVLSRHRFEDGAWRQLK